MKEAYEKDEYYYMQEIAKKPSDQTLYDGYKEWLDASIKKDIEDGKDTRIAFMRPWLDDKRQKLSFLEAQDAGDYEKMQRIASECNPNWLTIVSRPPILNCGRPNPEKDKMGREWWKMAQSCHREATYEEWLENHPRFEMDFVCHKKWNEMEPTENRKVRFCGDCKKNVYFCDDIVEARELGGQGCCIGIDVGVKRQTDEKGTSDLVGELAIFGRPSSKTIEKNKERLLPDRISAKRIMKKVELNMLGKGLPELDRSHDYRDK